MNDRDRCLEENAARLICAGFGAEVRPSASAGKRMFQLLETRQRRGRAAAAFPEGVLVPLAGTIALVAVVLTAQIVGWGVPRTVDLLFTISALLVASNLLCVPFGGIFIVARRLKHAPSTTP